MSTYVDTQVRSANGSVHQEALPSLTNRNEQFYQKHS